jgi:hypothetical protein
MNSLPWNSGRVSSVLQNLIASAKNLFCSLGHIDQMVLSLLLPSTSRWNRCWGQCLKFFTAIADSAEKQIKI